MHKPRNSWVYFDAIELAFTHTNCKIPGCTSAFMHSQFHQIPGRTTCKCEMLMLLTIHAIPGHTYKRIPKISYITMQNEESGGTFVRYRYFHRPRVNSFRQFVLFSAMCIYICIYINSTTFNCMTANLFLKTKKTTNLQMYEGYSGRHCIT